MSRDDLLFANSDVVTTVARETSKLSPDAIFIIVTNPMDVMTQIAWKVSGFAPGKVMGMGGVLDSARYRTFVALELGVSPEDVEGIVLGGHGDQMVPVPRFTTVKGLPLTEFLTDERISELIQRTRQGGAEIVSLLKTGSAYYAPAASTFQMVRSILLDERRVLPCAAYLDGEYGIKGVFVGVPVVLGRNGVERIIEIRLTGEEKVQFGNSAAAVRTSVDKVLSK
jgi:malate dehydrogenase